MKKNGDIKILIYAGQLYNGIHKSMITDAEFETIQSILENRSRPRPKTPLRFLLSGHIDCGECGMKVTFERHKKHYKTTGRTQEFVYGRCTKKNKDIKCSQKYIRAEELEKQLVNYFETIEIDPDFGNWAAKWCNYLNEQEKETQNAHREAIEKEYKQITTQIDNLLNLKISEANINGTLLSDRTDVSCPCSCGAGMAVTSRLFELEVVGVSENSAGRRISRKNIPLIFLLSLNLIGFLIETLN